jgi:hypothetical protein
LQCAPTWDKKDKSSEKQTTTQTKEVDMLELEDYQSGEEPVK